MTLDTTGQGDGTVGIVRTGQLAQDRDTRHSTNRTGTLDCGHGTDRTGTLKSGHGTDRYTEKWARYRHDRYTEKWARYRQDRVTGKWAQYRQGHWTSEDKTWDIRRHDTGHERGTGQDRIQGH